MFIFIILFLSITYIKFGLLPLIQIIIWLIVFISSNFLLSINPNKIEFHVIRFLSIITIFIILYINYEDSHTLSFILPFSKDKISLLYNFPRDIAFESFKNKEFKLNKTDIIENFLKHELSDLDNYAGYVTLSFSSDMAYLHISEFILFNKYSNAEIIENYIESILIYQESFIIRKKLSKYNRGKVKITFYYSKFEII